MWDYDLTFNPVSMTVEKAPRFVGNSFYRGFARQTLDQMPERTLDQVSQPHARDELIVPDLISDESHTNVASESPRV